MGKEAIEIKLPREDPKKKEDPTPKSNITTPEDIATEVLVPKDEEELSEEDRQLKDSLESAIQILFAYSSKTKTQKHEALAILRHRICTSTSSMTSVPKPLKFLRQFYNELKETYSKFKEEKQDDDIIKEYADILSVLAITMAPEESRESLTYKLQGNSTELAIWGHEYVRSLAGDLGAEYSFRTNDPSSQMDESNNDLMAIVNQVVLFHMEHNAEPEAIDILMEVNNVPLLLNYEEKIDDKNYQRICLYLLSLADYTSTQEELTLILDTVYLIYKKKKQYIHALRVVLLNSTNNSNETNKEKIKELFHLSQNIDVKKQMGILLARHKCTLYEYQDDSDMVDTSETINDIINNSHLHEHFQYLAKELDVMEVKTPEDIYKSHLAGNSIPNNLTVNNNMDSAKHNLATCFVNAFVNAGYGKDSLITNSNNDSNNNDSWLYKNKESGMLCAAASMGMIMQWNVEEGISSIDKFLYSNDKYIKAGAILGIGIVSSGVKNECDPALALLSEHLEAANSTATKDLVTLPVAILGLAIAYAGTGRSDIADLLIPFIVNNNENKIAAFATLALGFIFVGTCDEEVASTILQYILEKYQIVDNKSYRQDDTFFRFVALGLGLLFLGCQNKVDAILEAIKTIDHDPNNENKITNNNTYIGKYINVTLITCAYAGTGNVLKIQEMLHLCAEHHKNTSEDIPNDNTNSVATGLPSDNSTKNDANTNNTATPAVPTDTNNSMHLSKYQYDYQSVAAFGIGLMTMGESVGHAMTLRVFDHLLQYSDVHVKRAVPLGYAILSISNADYALIDILSKLTHDSDETIAGNAIMGLGLISGGTNNSRVAGLLRQLSVFYNKEPNLLFLVRIAQGLLHMGKGLMTLNPYHSDRLLLSGTSVAGLLTLFHACLDFNDILLTKCNYLLYILVTCMQPRMLITLDENMKPLPVIVRVGQAVETVGQAGKPKAITGFQTHSTPVLLGVKDRAELATDEYMPVAGNGSTILEGLVILKKNPDYQADTN